MRLRRLILLGLLLLASPAWSLPSDADFATAEQQIQHAPKSVLDRAAQVLAEMQISDPSRSQWLALGSEAAYALALPDVALKYASEGLQRPGLDVELQQRLAIAHAQALDLSGKSEESVKELMTVIGTLEKGGFDPQLMVDALNARASAYYSFGNFRASLADLLRVYPLAPEHGIRTIRADVANALGNVYAAIQDYIHAEQFYRETIDYSISNKTWVRASIAEYSLAAVLRRQENWPEAAVYFERSREHSAQSDDIQGVAYAEYGLAQVALQLGEEASRKDDPNQAKAQIDKAERMYVAALPVFAEANDLLPQANIAFGLAKIAAFRKQHSTTLKFIDQALTLIDQIKEFDFKQQVLTLKADTEVALGDYRNAYESLKQASAAREAFVEMRSNESLSELKVRFDSERQEQQNQLLLKENQLQAATVAEQKQTARLYAVSVIALLCVLGFLVYLGYRNKQVRARLAAQALTDELTGVANRRHAMAVLAAEFDRARRYRTPLSIAMFDLDHFKQINDRFGHAAGDEVLIAFSHSINNKLRKTDCFGRIGGEEFLAVLPHTDPAMAEMVMERMRNATLALDCPRLMGALQPSVSIGIAQLGEQDKSVEDLVRRADEAVYKAKQSGRNRVVLAEIAST